MNSLLPRENESHVVLRYSRINFDRNPGFLKRCPERLHRRVIFLLLMQEADLKKILDPNNSDPSAKKAGR